MNNNIVKKFLEQMGTDAIMCADAAFLPFTVFFDWLRYYDRAGQSHELKPILFHKVVGGIVKFYLNDTEYCRAAEEGLSAYLENPEYMDRTRKKYDELTELIDREYLSLFITDHDYSEEELYSKVKVLHLALVELVKITLPIERLDKDIVTKVCGASINLDKVWHVSEMTDFESFETRNSKYILEILETGKNIDLLRYIYTGYTALPSREEVEAEVAKIDRLKLVDQIKESEATAARNKESKAREFESLSGSEQKLLTYIDWVMETRDHRKAYISKSEIQLACLGQKLFGLWGIDPNLAAHLSILELIKGKDYILANVDKFKERLGGYTLLYAGEGNEIEQTTEDVEASIKQLDEIIIKQHANAKQADELAGEIASRGLARGKVSMILSMSEFGKFEPGDILVAPMTRPEYVPLMRQASAIVTDEGGITCHAAIVSRELKKPCIIGTKIATKILKDGDLVEVDADKGVVRIIK